MQLIGFSLIVRMTCGMRYPIIKGKLFFSRSYHKRVKVKYVVSYDVLLNINTVKINVQYLGHK